MKRYLIFMMLSVPVGDWPDNEYTKSLPRPTVGTVARAWINTDREYCSIELSGMEQSDSEAYVEALKAAGFREIERVSEEIEGQAYVSVGIVLSDGNVDLSIAYIPDYLGLYIRLNG